MNCGETTRLLDAQADGELDLPTSLAVQEHLDGCAACRRSYASLQAVRAAIARHATAPAPPRELADRFLAPAPRPP